MHQNIYYIMGVHPHDDGHVYRRLLGKFHLSDGNFQMLEDHDNLGYEKMTPEMLSTQIRALKHSQRRELINGEDLRQGLYPHLLPSVDKDRDVPATLSEAMAKQLKPAPIVSRFDYMREGMPSPQTLEVHENNHSYLDGHELLPHEVKHIMENVKSGKGTIRHKLSKSENEQKEDTGHLFKDTMMPSFGNKLAYSKFMAEGKPGIHIHINGNHIGSINKTYNHEIGNNAVIAIGKALRQAMDETVGSMDGKLFREGSDKFKAHVANAEDAAKFARSVRQKLEGIPTLRGTHKLSVTMGYGKSPEHADEAMKDAMAERMAAGKPEGQAGTHIAYRAD